MEQEQKNHALMTFGGSILALAGYYLPWYSLVFEPPGGFVIINGQQLNAFTYAYSGLNQSNTSTGQLLHPTIILMFLIGVFDLFRLFLSPATTKKAIHVIATILQAKFTGDIVDIIQALAHIIVSLSWIAFLFLYVGLGKVAIPNIFANNLGGGAGAYQASHYISVHFGIGLILILAGLIIGGIAVLQKIALVAGILLCVFIVLVITHSPYLGQFFHFLGF